MRYHRGLWAEGGDVMAFSDFIVVVICGLIMFAQFPCPCLGYADFNPSVAGSLNRSHGLRIQSEYGPALMLPLSGPPVEHQRHQRGRELMADARMTLHDDLLTKGYYTSRVYIGTPPQEFALIVDTGSTVTYVPCSTCTHCGSHQDPRFKPDKSSSYKVIGCRSPDCKTAMCDNNNQCRYERMYAEMSSSQGTLGADQMGFGLESRLRPQTLLFGCETVETGDLYLQHADGIMGLGRGPLSIVDQLVGSGAMGDAFSLCYGGMDEGGGAMVLGPIPPLPGMVFTSSDSSRSNYYNLNLSEIQVQGIRLDLDSQIFNGKFGTVLDSGTTYAYLPDQAFEAFKDAIIQQLGLLQAVDGPDPNYRDICYAGAGSDPKQLYKHFPPVDFIFGEDRKVTLAPENYLFKHTKVPGAYCLGIFKNQDATTLLGGIVVRNMLVTYDRANHQIGFLKTNCTDLWSILPADTTSPAMSPPPAASPPSAQSPSKSPDHSSPAVLPPSVENSTASPPLAETVQQDFESIELVIALDANYSTFLNQSSLFLSSLATELAVLRSEVSIEEVKAEDRQVVVQCLISAHPPEVFSTTSAKAMVARLENDGVHLPEVFGSYHLRSWKGLPPSKWRWLHSKKVRVGVVIAALVGAVMMLAAVASLLYWYLWRYRDKDLVKYNNLDRGAEEETLMSDQL